MTYNVETFKSESYQKILKAVLKFRYPKSTYEEALKEESKYCTALAYGKNKPLVKCLLEIEYDDTAYVFAGTPITICEVTDMLNKFTEGMYLVYRENAILDMMDDDRTDKIITLNFMTYHLHEQSQKTIDKIAELIKL